MWPQSFDAATMNAFSSPSRQRPPDLCGHNFLANWVALLEGDYYIRIFLRVNASGLRIHSTGIERKILCTRYLHSHGLMSFVPIFPPDKNGKFGFTEHLGQVLLVILNWVPSISLLLLICYLDTLSHKGALWIRRTLSSIRKVTAIGSIYCLNKGLGRQKQTFVHWTPASQPQNLKHTRQIILFGNLSCDSSHTGQGMGEGSFWYPPPTIFSNISNKMQFLCYMCKPGTCIFFPRLLKPSLVS